MNDNQIVYYTSIPNELKRLGLTQKKACKLLGISRSGLNHRIAANTLAFHLQIFGLANYLIKSNNKASKSEYLTIRSSNGKKIRSY
jgi:hypothetical protein